jgi:hypothetical protein
MKDSRFALALMTTAFTCWPACSDSSPTRKTDGAAADANVAFSVAACQADTCGAEATKCGWTTSEAKYLGCLSDCEVLGTIATRCPHEAMALYACADLGAKVDCTTGKGTGCDAETQALAACLDLGDAGH